MSHRVGWMRVTLVPRAAAAPAGTVVSRSEAARGLPSCFPAAVLPAAGLPVGSRLRVYPCAPGRGPTWRGSGSGLAAVGSGVFPGVDVQALQLVGVDTLHDLR